MEAKAILKGFFHDNINMQNSVLVSFDHLLTTHKSSSPGNKSNILINFILQSDIFVIYYKEVVDRVFSKMINTVVFESQIQLFMKFFLENYVTVSKCFDIYVLEKQIILTECVQRELTEFVTISVNKYLKTDIHDPNVYIKEIMASINSDTETLGDRKINKYLEEMTTSVIQNYGNVVIESLDTDICSEVFVKKYHDSTRKKPNLYEINRFLNFVNDYDRLSDIFLTTESEYFDSNFDSIVSHFTKVFDREITVFEYRKFYNICKSHNPKDVFDKYLLTYNERFYIVENLYNEYLLTNLTYLKFCDTFLIHIDLDLDGFLDKIISILINSDVYKSKMENKISEIYTDLYDERISTIDHKYFFQNVCLGRLSLFDENLKRMISDLKNKTDGYLCEISNIFVSILSRKCDEYEEKKYINYYRDDSSDITPMFIIQDELYESLEYQDVIKDWLVGQLNIKNNSVVYMILKHIQTSFSKNKTRDLESILDELKLSFGMYFL